MGKLIYSITTSLDGYVADANGDFNWAEPSEEVHGLVNEIEADTGTFVLGRNMYETLAAWDTIPSDGPSAAVNQFATLWRAADKIVYSRSLGELTTKKSQLKHSFDPSFIETLKARTDKNLSIGGPILAAEAIKVNLIDEYHLFIAPIIIGEGKHWLPKHTQLQLKLVDQRSFANGFVYLKYLASN